VHAIRIDQTEWSVVQDEILAEDEKFVLRVEDLLSWATIDLDDDAGQPRLSYQAPGCSPSQSHGDEQPVLPTECNFCLSFLSCIAPSKIEQNTEDSCCFTMLGPALFSAVVRTALCHAAPTTWNSLPADLTDKFSY